jgi:hypothetical protein
LTIERLLDEKRSFDLATQFEKLGTENEETGWKKPCLFSMTQCEYIATDLDISSRAGNDR